MRGERRHEERDARERPSDVGNHRCHVTRKRIWGVAVGYKIIRSLDFLRKASVKLGIDFNCLGYLDCVYSHEELRRA